MSIEVQHSDSKDGVWTVAWRVSIPVRGLIFHRQKDVFRARSWEILTPGAYFSTFGAAEVLVVPEPSQEFKIRFRGQNTEVINDYAFLTMFSDGGGVLFAGHLKASAFNCARSTCPGPGLTEIPVESVSTVYRPRPGDSILTSNQGSTGEVTIGGDPDGLVYFGRARPVDTAEYTAVFDPELPRWLRRDFGEQLPRILQIFRHQTGFALDAKPLVFFPISLGQFEKMSRSSGGVIGRQVLLSLEGGSWQRRTRELRETFFRLLAHESFHLWNANRFNSPEAPGGAWLHEGSAEALSVRALLDLSLIGRARYLELQSEAINRCIIGRDMRNGAGASDARREMRSQYDCGSALHFLMQSAADDGAGTLLYRFWNRLFNRAEANGRLYTHEMFLQEAHANGDAGLAQKISEFTAGASARTDAFFHGAFQELGVSASSMSIGFPDWYKQLVGQRAVEFLIDQDCQGRGFYSVFEDRLELIGSTGCRSVRSNQSVESIEDYVLFGQGVEAYDHIQRICELRPQGEVILRNLSGVLPLACAQMPRRPQFLQFDTSEIALRLFR